mmetsp:Transcript_26832/g.58702  ORF Transcript_26832/g.58702 Transcript_26832/m.58702 type:complete len:108 (-) Transcript_26832:701-1024(-)
MFISERVQYRARARTLVGAPHSLVRLACTVAGWLRTLDGDLSLGHGHSIGGSSGGIGGSNGPGINSINLDNIANHAPSHGTQRPTPPNANGALPTEAQMSAGYHDVI